MPLKVALCFIINYEHELVKEHLWKKWIEPNKDIINVYFFYANYEKIKSDWIKNHAIPQQYIKETKYTHVLPAYIQLLHFAYNNYHNEWFIFLTDFCIPIISPAKFRQLFFMYHDRTLMSYKPAWWNIHQQTRANLKYLPTHLHLANTPWFTLTRKHVVLIKKFIKNHNNMTTTIYNGPVANESFFAIVLKIYDELNNKNHLNINSHIADWNRMTSSTSPHIFKNYTKENKTFIDDNLENNNFAMFLRKIDNKFPDNDIENIWQLNSNLNNDNLTLLNMYLHFYLPTFICRNKSIFANIGYLFIVGILLINYNKHYIF